MAEYINKESAISIFNAKAEMAVCTPAQPYFANAAKMIEILPAADVAPVVHGRWQQIGYDEAMNRITCSCCLEYWNITDNDTETFNYCPNCGARMDLEV